MPANCRAPTRHKARHVGRLAACAPPTMLLCVVACSTTPPKIKEGLWEIRGQSVETPGDKTTAFKYTLCRNHAYDDAATARLKSVKGCNTLVKDQGAGKFESASVCNVAGTNIISNGLTTYFGDKATHSETQAQYKPALTGKTAEKMTEDQQYLGACPPGMKPGDTLGANGIILHHD